MTKRFKRVSSGRAVFAAVWKNEMRKGTAKGSLSHVLSPKSVTAPCLTAVGIAQPFKGIDAYYEKTLSLLHKLVSFSANCSSIMRAVLPLIPYFQELPDDPLCIFRNGFCAVNLDHRTRERFRPSFDSR